MSEIAVLIPVYGRPDSAARVYQSLRDSAADASPYFIVSPDDEAGLHACLQHATTFIAPFTRGHADWARKINYGYQLTDEPFLLLGADDLHFHPGWDVEVLKVARSTNAGVTATNDLGNPHVMRGHLATHALINRRYVWEHGTIDEPGKILHEGYFHNWVDAELTETAQARRLFAFAKRSHVEHLHPSWGKAPRDATYEIALDQSRFEQDRRLLQERRGLWKAQRRQARSRR